MTAAGITLSQHDAPMELTRDGGTKFGGAASRGPRTPPRHHTYPGRSCEYVLATYDTLHYDWFLGVLVGSLLGHATTSDLVHL